MTINNPNVFGHNSTKKEMNFNEYKLTIRSAKIKANKRDLEIKKYLKKIIFLFIINEDLTEKFFLFQIHLKNIILLYPIDFLKIITISILNLNKIF